MAEENRAMRLTLRGNGSERQASNTSEKIFFTTAIVTWLIFSSPRQLQLLSSCTHIIADGTFKYAPKKTMQIYRVFGMLQSLGLAQNYETAALKKFVRMLGCSQITPIVANGALS
uniref:Transposase n=1 Tax=Ditylenchus dipsaci TaxID=166011 RepID=A0A915ERD8_9BILA